MESVPSPLSKTAKYKKITKPLLERKRRARINRCLDELKELMVGALEIDDENLSKLEKADILELTVNHLTKLHRLKDPVLEAKRFKAGFGRCAAEACKFIKSVPDIDSTVSKKLITHLSRLSKPLSVQVPERPSFSPPISPASVVSDRQQYYSDVEKSSSDAEDSVYSADSTSKFWNVEKIPTNKNRPQLNGLSPKHDAFLQDAFRNRNYSNKAPSECKDVILQKIRQHIMGKREHDNLGNERCFNQRNLIWHPRSPKYIVENSYQNQTAGPHLNNNDTLDLRLVRSPINFDETYPVKEKLLNAEKARVMPEGKNMYRIVNAPVHCSLMDYSNLPPKKKAKLIEFQENQKQEEEARRELDAYAKEQRNKLNEDMLLQNQYGDTKWRPW